MVIVTYDTESTALHHTISENQNVISEYYHKVLESDSGESFATSRATKATTFLYRYSTTYDVQKCTLPCDKTWDWASGKEEVRISNIFPTFQASHCDFNMLLKPLHGSEKAMSQHGGSLQISKRNSVLITSFSF
jgi:hypothetical protein